MSTLNKNVRTQLDEYCPPEYDENWVNKLLTDTEANDSPNKTIRPISKKALSTARELALLEAEIRKQRIIRKAKVSTNTETKKPAKKIKSSPLSAIERQQQAYKSDKKVPCEEHSKAKNQNLIGRALSRIKKR